MKSPIDCEEFAILMTNRINQYRTCFPLEYVTITENHTVNIQNTATRFTIEISNPDLVIFSFNLWKLTKMITVVNLVAGCSWKGDIDFDRHQFDKDNDFIILLKDAEIHEPVHLTKYKKIKRLIVKILKIKIDCDRNKQLRIEL